MQVLQYSDFPSDGPVSNFTFSPNFEKFYHTGMLVLYQTVQSFFRSAISMTLIDSAPLCIIPLNFGPSSQVLYNIKLSSQQGYGSHHLI